MKDFERQLTAMKGYQRPKRQPTTGSDSQAPETRMTAKDRQQHSATGNDYMETRLEQLKKWSVNLAVTKGEKFAKEHRTEDETKSDIHV